MNGGRTMGKLYFGTYVKVEDTDETGMSYVTVPGLKGVEGIVHTSDYVQQAEARREQAASRSSKRRTYITGPRGGCYYIDSNGNKVYVDHSFCQ